MRRTKRVFIGIKASAALAQYCVSLQPFVASPHVRLILPQDMHLTLVPPWEVSDERSVIQILQDAVVHFEPFTLALDLFTGGPDHLHPSLFWVECVASPKLVALKNELAIAFNLKDQRPFIPHITIARRKKGDEERLTLPGDPRRVEFHMTVDSVQLFESPSHGGVGYTVLASIPFQRKNAAA